MAKIKIVDYIPEHLERLEQREVHHGEGGAGINTPAVTFLVDDKPIAIVGYFFLCPGVLQVWSLFSPDTCRYPLAFYKSIRNLIDYAFDSMQVRRVQMSVKVGYALGWKWAKSLGFKCEGIMSQYGNDGSDYHLFSRVKHVG